MGEPSEVDFPIYIVLGGILGMLLLALAVIAFFLVYQKRLFAQREAMREMESAHQKGLLQHSFKTQEQERQRIASDLHDSIGSTLSAVRFYVHQLSSDPPLANQQEIKTEANTLLDAAIDQIRGISHNLFPPDLEHLGFTQAINAFFQRIQKLHGLTIQLDIDENLNLDQDKALAFYRIIQELVNNTLKHAEATKIELSLKNVGSLTLLYQDDGKGFEVETLKHSAVGLGLKSIESRASAIGATIVFRRGAKRGMVFQMELMRKASSGGRGSLSGENFR